ncbi:carbohydrate ABC transporter permease [Gorillibacterium sp. sgz500922]|uniref:carbohydrate ABC transporter permease n=1 Tax=Gorillibacterium sp. sgz500922 TaxID=3446694 RepID=UPI003F66DEFC
MSKDVLKNPWIYLLFIVPTIALYFLFFIYPMGSSAFYAFTDWSGLDSTKFIGLHNFREAFGDVDFRHSIVNNLWFIVFSVFIQVPMIIFFALLIGNVKRLQGFYKTTVFMPSILSTSVIGILWSFIYEPEVGFLNTFLGKLGISPIYWLSDPHWAMFSILMTNAWQWMGFYIVLVLAAILAIPKEINEAAAIDGANAFQQAVRITVPLIRPIISVVVMLSIAGAMRVVDIVLVMTDGGPVGSTEVMASYMVHRSIKIGQFGYGTAISLIIFAFALILTSLYQLTFGRNSERIEY